MIYLILSVLLYKRERERENSELYYTRIKILGSCLFVQSVPANLHATRTIVTKLTTAVMMKKMIRCPRETETEGERRRRRKRLYYTRIK